MSYNPATLHCGDVLLMTRHSPLWAPAGALDGGITVSTVNPFDHSAVVVEKDGQLVIVEALWHVTVSPLDKYALDGWAYHTPLTPEQQAILSQVALSKVGQRYGVIQVLESFLRDDIHIDLHPALDPRHLDCSGLCAWTFQQAGYPLTYAPVPSPADLSYSPLLLGPRPWNL